MLLSHVADVPGLSYLALAEFHAGHCDLAERLIEQSCNTIEERLEVSGSTGGHASSAMGLTWPATL